jgi:6,7-dimethyl-8-ribityllumazine synthase
MSRARPAPSDTLLPADVRIATVVARFNADITQALLEGCLRRLEELGVGTERVDVFHVPGAFEIPLAAKLAASSRQYASVICLGCVIRGDTPHFDFVAGECARGVASVALESCVPVIFGVLTTDNHAQARERAGGNHGHAGVSAAEASADMILLARKLPAPET